MRLRAALVLVLVALLSLGATANAANSRLVAERANAMKTAVPPKSASPSMAQASTVATADQQSLDRLAQRQANRGCGISLTPAQPKRKVGTCTVLLIGDSMGNNLGAGLSYQLERTRGIDLIRRSKGSTGLSNSWFYDWPVELKPMLSRYKPNLVIMMLGANDRQNMKVPGDTLSFGTTKWKTAYRANIDKVTTMVTAAGSYLLWVGLPVMEPHSYGEGMALLNQIYADQAPRTAGVSFLNVWDYLADGSGNYRGQVRISQGVITIRSGDGIHFSTSGTRVLASYVIMNIRDIYSVDRKSTRLNSSHT